MEMNPGGGGAPRDVSERTAMPEHHAIQRRNRLHGKRTELNARDTAEVAREVVGALDANG